MSTLVTKLIWPLAVLFCMNIPGHAEYADSGARSNIEKYCDEIDLFAEREKNKRFFALVENKGSGTWREFATRSARDAAIGKQDNQTTAEVSIRSGKTTWVAIQAASDVQWMKGEIEFASRSLSTEYYFYSNGKLAELSSQWMNGRHWEGEELETVRREKLYNSQGEQLISTTEYTDTDEGFSDKPTETLPALYRHVNKLPFYELLKKPKAEQ